MANDYSHLGFTSEDEEQAKVVPSPTPAPVEGADYSKLEFSPEQVEESILEEALGSLGAGAAGFAQGFTFGGGTKALGALEAIAELQDDLKLKDLYERYKELSSKRKKEYEELSEKHKAASLIGQVGGMLVNPLPGTAAKAAVEAAGAAKLTKLLQLEKLAPKLVSRVGAGGLLGGGASAIESEAEGKEYLKDIAIGTGLGMAVGAGESALAGAGKLGKEYIEKSPKIQRIIRAFELSKGTPFEMNPNAEPIALTEEVTRKGGGPSKIFEQLNRVKSEITNSFRNMYNSAKDEFDDFFDKNGKTVLPSESKEIGDIVNVINNNKQQLKKHIGSDLVDKLTNFNVVKDPSTGVVTVKNYQGTVSDLYDLRRALLDKVDKLMDTDVIDRDVQKALFGEGKKGGLIDAIDDTLDKMFPDMDADGLMSKGYTTLKNNIDIAASPLEQVINKTLSQEARSRRLSDLSKAKATEIAENAFDSMLQRFGPGYGDTEKRYVFNQMIDKYEDVLGHLYENSPKFKDQMRRAIRGLKAKNPDIELKGGKEDINEALTFIREKMLKQPSAMETLHKNLAGEDLIEAKKAITKYGKDLYAKMGVMAPSEAERLGVQAGKDISTLRTVLGERSTQDVGLKDIIGVPVPSGSGLPLELTAQTAAGMGSAVRGVQDLATSLPSYIKTPIVAAAKAPVNLKKASVDQLKEYAQILSNSSNPSVSNIGRSAIESLEESPTAKAAFINMAMQSPTIREMLNLSVDRSKEK